jgi:hypothetical protein
MEPADEAAPSIGEWIDQHPLAAVAVGLGAAAGCAAAACGYAALRRGQMQQPVESKEFTVPRFRSSSEWVVFDMNDTRSGTPRRAAR